MSATTLFSATTATSASPDRWPDNAPAAGSSVAPAPTVAESTAAFSGGPFELGANGEAEACPSPDAAICSGVAPDLPVGRRMKVGASAAGIARINGIPEPATWTLMILGVGMVGAALRRRSGLAA